MAMVREIPREVSLVVDIKVAIPSGMLCIIIASIDIIPTLYRELLFGDIFFPIIELVSIPISIDIIMNNSINSSGKVLLNILIDSGIRSVIEIHNITPLANARDEIINLFIFFVFINMGMIPKRVDKPDIRVNKKAILIFIYFTNKIYE